MLSSPISFAHLYASVLGLGIICGSGLFVQLASGIQVKQYSPALGILFHVATSVAGTAALLLLAEVLILRWLERKRFKELYRYMAQQVKAGADSELAVERTRKRMYVEIERAGGYLRWLVGRGRV